MNFSDFLAFPSAFKDIPTDRNCRWRLSLSITLYLVFLSAWLQPGQFIEPRPTRFERSRACLVQVTRCVFTVHTELQSQTQHTTADRSPDFPSSTLTEECWWHDNQRKIQINITASETSFTFFFYPPFRCVYLIASQLSSQAKNRSLRNSDQFYRWILTHHQRGGNLAVINHL